MANELVADAASDSEVELWTPIETLKGTDLEWSTVIVLEVLDGDGILKKKNRCVLVLWWRAHGRPRQHTDAHLDIIIKPRAVRVCKPKTTCAARQIVRC